MLSNKKVIILAERDFEDMELMYPKYRLIEEGAKVIVAGLGEKQYVGKKGYPVDTDANIQDLNPDDFDAVIIPGGWAPDYLRAHSKVIGFVKKMNAENKIVAFICHGGWVAASAEIIKGKKATGVDRIKDDLVHAGAKFVDKSVVVDGNLISSRRPADLPDFMREIIKKLS